MDNTISYLLVKIYRTIDNTNPIAEIPYKIIRPPGICFMLFKLFTVFSKF